MEFLLVGLLLLGFGCSLIFARDASWAVQKFSHQLKGQISERTLVWEVSQMGLGVIAIAVSIALIWQGLDRINQPVIPGICILPPSGSAYDGSDKLGIARDIETGCEAAKQKDYQTALLNFTRAVNNIDRDKGFYSYREPLVKAIRQMNQQLSTKQ